MKILIITLLMPLLSYGMISQDCVTCDLPEITDQISTNINLMDDFNAIEKEIKKGPCQYFDKFIRSGVPKEALQQAISFHLKNPHEFKSKYISIGDYSQNSKHKRYYLLNMKTGHVKKYKVSHGSGYKDGANYGDSNHDGFIDRCQHPKSKKRTNMTRPGFFRTGKTYYSKGTCSEEDSKKLKSMRKKKYSWRKKCTHEEFMNSRGKLVYGWPNVSKKPKRNALRLHGLSPGVNNNAYNNGVVMHGAYYNLPGNETNMGRSYGCPAFTQYDAKEIISKIKGKSLYYSYVPKCSKDMKKIKKQVPGWERTCLSKD